jgi:hypothetical protein
MLKNTDGSAGSPGASSVLNLKWKFKWPGASAFCEGGKPRDTEVRVLAGSRAEVRRQGDTILRPPPGNPTALRVSRRQAGRSAPGPARARAGASGRGRGERGGRGSSCSSRRGGGGSGGGESPARLQLSGGGGDGKACQDRSLGRAGGMGEASRAARERLGGEVKSSWTGNFPTAGNFSTVGGECRAGRGQGTHGKKRVGGSGPRAGLTTPGTGRWFRSPGSRGRVIEASGGRGSRGMEEEVPPPGPPRCHQWETRACRCGPRTAGWATAGSGGREESHGEQFSASSPRARGDKVHAEAQGGGLHSSVDAGRLPAEAADTQHFVPRPSVTLKKLNSTSHLTSDIISRTCESSFESSEVMSGNNLYILL